MNAAVRHFIIVCPFLRISGPTLFNQPKNGPALNKPPFYLLPIL